MRKELKLIFENSKSFVTIIIIIFFFLMINVVNVRADTVDTNELPDEELSGVEYTAVVAYNNEGIVLAKRESGFDSTASAIKYALFNRNTQGITMEYTELPGILQGENTDANGFLNLASNDYGIFSYYSYDEEGNRREAIFLSATTGEYLSKNIITYDLNSIVFWQSEAPVALAPRAVVLIPNWKNPGNLTLAVLDINGRLSNLEAEGYDKEILEGYSCQNMTNYSMDISTCTAYMFANTQGEKKLLVYNHISNKAVCIEDQNTLNMFNDTWVECDGTDDDLIHIYDLSDDTGNNYTAVYNFSGEVIKSPYTNAEEDYYEADHYVDVDGDTEDADNFDVSGFDDEVDKKLIGQWRYEDEESGVIWWITFRKYGTYHAFSTTSGGAIVNNFYTNADEHVMLVYTSSGETETFSYSIDGKELMLDDYVLKKTN